MRIMKWIAGISLVERRKSQDIRRMWGIRNVKDRAGEVHPRYYGHVIRREEVELIKRANNTDEKECGVGRQWIIWMSVLRRDMGWVVSGEDDARNRKIRRNLT
ncbi:uncharacterized protein [Palaemon carinicauda]|uniref:uncharacterized protein n=1 Tax=Palaemon carinicauda TaxID=392227 RepID=UPI0035B68D7F